MGGAYTFLVQLGVAQLAHRLAPTRRPVLSEEAEMWQVLVKWQGTWEVGASVAQRAAADALREQFARQGLTTGLRETARGS